MIYSFYRPLKFSNVHRLLRSFTIKQMRLINRIWNEIEQRKLEITRVEDQLNRMTLKCLKSICLCDIIKLDWRMEALF